MPEAPSHPAELFVGAVAAMRDGRMADAERLCLAVIETDPGHFDALRMLAVVQSRLGRREEALRHYDLALALRPDHAETLSNRGNVLKELGRFSDALDSYDRAIAAQPDFADAHYNRAILLKETGRPEEALLGYETVLMLRPEHAIALNNRGNVLTQLGRYAEAVASFDRAIRIKPDYAEAFHNRGNALHEFEDDAAAIESFDQAIAFRPDYAEAYNNRGIALKAKHRFDEALASHLKAQELVPDFTEAHWNEALLRLLAGDFTTGFAKYEWRWKRDFVTSPRRDFAQPQWDGLASLYGRRILLHAEQGLGDTVQFCRYVPLVAARGAHVIVEVPRSLHHLMTSLSGVSELVLAGEPLPTFDLHCPFMSLPLAFSTKLNTIPAEIPYLHPPADAVAAWEARLAEWKRPFIGLVWAGGPAHFNDRKRSIELAKLLPLTDFDATFVSLQKDLRPGDEDLLRQRSDILEYGRSLNDLADAAALVSCLDLVIAVDTCLAHVAGALGKPVFILLPHTPDWRWLLDRDDSPWYPTARLFRQPQPRAWDEAIAEVASALPVTARSRAEKEPAQAPS